MGKKIFHLGDRVLVYTTSLEAGIIVYSDSYSGEGLYKIRILSSGVEQHWWEKDIEMDLVYLRDKKLKEILDK